MPRTGYAISLDINYATSRIATLQAELERLQARLPLLQEEARQEREANPVGEPKPYVAPANPWAEVAKGMAEGTCNEDGSPTWKGRPDPWANW